MNSERGLHLAALLIGVYRPLFVTSLCLMQFESLLPWVPVDGSVPSGYRICFCGIVCGVVFGVHDMYLLWRLTAYIINFSCGMYIVGTPSLQVEKRWEQPFVLKWSNPMRITYPGKGDKTRWSKTTELDHHGHKVNCKPEPRWEEGKRRPSPPTIAKYLYTTLHIN